MADTPRDVDVEREESAAPHALDDTSGTAPATQDDDIAARLRQLQTREGYSDETLASLLDMSPEDVREILSGGAVPEEAVDHLSRWLGPDHP